VKVQENPPNLSGGTVEKVPVREVKCHSLLTDRNQSYRAHSACEESARYEVTEIFLEFNLRLRR